MPAVSVALSQWRRTLRMSGSYETPGGSIGIWLGRPTSGPARGSRGRAIGPPWCPRWPAPPPFGIPPSGRRAAGLSKLSGGPFADAQTVGRAPAGRNVPSVHSRHGHSA